MPDSRPIISFDRQQNELHWQSIGDSIMGGKSDGQLSITVDGQGDFHGTVRLDNGGGFASVKSDLPQPIDASGWLGIQFLARGDGKTYKVGLRTSTDRRSIVYQHSFTPSTFKPSTDEWSEVRLPFSEFIPTWRGKTLADAEPLDSHHLAAVSLFVSGRQAGEFSLLMQDWTLFKR